MNELRETTVNKRLFSAGNLLLSFPNGSLGTRTMATYRRDDPLQGVLEIIQTDSDVGPFTRFGAGLDQTSLRRTSTSSSIFGPFGGDMPSTVEPPGGGSMMAGRRLSAWTRIRSKLLAADVVGDDKHNALAAAFDLRAPARDRWTAIRRISSWRPPCFRFKVLVSSILLVRRPNDDQAALGPRNGTAHQNDVILGVDLDDVEIADGDAGVAVMAGGLVPELRPAGTAVAGVRADGAGLTVDLLGAVGGREDHGNCGVS